MGVSKFKSGKQGRSVWCSDTAWEGFVEYGKLVDRSTSWLIEQEGLRLRSEHVVKGAKVEKAAKTEDFELFWSLYPKHEAKGAAEKAWAKVPVVDRPEVLLKLKSFRFPIDRQFIPLPASWLNAKRWLDEGPEDVAVQPSLIDWEQAPDHIKAIRTKMVNREETSDMEGELLGEFMQTFEG